MFVREWKVSKGAMFLLAGKMLHRVRRGITKTTVEMAVVKRGLKNSVFQVDCTLSDGRDVRHLRKEDTRMTSGF